MEMHYHETRTVQSRHVNFVYKLSLHNDPTPCSPICITRGTKTFISTDNAPQGIMKVGVKSGSLERMAVGRPGLKLHAYVHKW